MKTPSPESTLSTLHLALRQRMGGGPNPADGNDALAPRKGTWGASQEHYADTIKGLQLLFQNVKRRYQTALPHPAMERIKGCVINKAQIAILTEDEDDVIQTRLQLVNLQAGKTGLDRSFNERNNQVARVALRGPPAGCDAALWPSRTVGHRHSPSEAGSLESGPL